jgi:D-galactosamine 6-phosphate deaminase/isomerase
VNPLARMAALPSPEKQERGLLYTPAEILQQPATWQTTWRLFREMRDELAGFLRKAREEQWTVFLIGAGTSDYIGRSLTGLLRQSWGTEVMAVASTDLLAGRDEFLIDGRKYLWISFSRSGESPEGVAVLEQALASCPNVKHVVVSCNAKGRMARLASDSSDAIAVVLDDAVNDRGLAMTSSFTNMLLLGQALAHLWEPKGFEVTLERMTAAAEYLLDKGSQLALEIAAQRSRLACFVGAGGLTGAAKESGLKLTELTGGRVVALTETTLGLRHGPMSALNRETALTAYIAGSGRQRRYDLDLVREIRAKDVVRTIVGVGAEEKAADHTLCCDAFQGIGDEYRPTVDVIFGQMLGLFSSVELGLKPDSPSPGGVISRVVPPFTIYP